MEPREHVEIEPHIREVSAVTMKLPTFWTSDPALWFAQVEAIFSTKRIVSQQSKFNFVIASLTPEIAIEVRDLIINPPQEDPFTILKTELINRTTASEQQRLQKLISSEELGDRKPSQLLRHLNLLLGNTVIDQSLLKELFLQRLPANVRMVLATSDSLSLETQASIADKVMEVTSSVNASTISGKEEIFQLRNELNELKKLIAERLPFPSSPCRSRRSSSKTRMPQESSSNLCWYHHNYANKAKKCIPPCTFKTTGNDVAQV